MQSEGSEHRALVCGAVPKGPRLSFALPSAIPQSRLGIRANLAQDWVSHLVLSLPTVTASLPAKEGKPEPLRAMGSSLLCSWGSTNHEACQC